MGTVRVMQLPFCLFTAGLLRDPVAGNQDGGQGRHHQRALRFVGTSLLLQRKGCTARAQADVGGTTGLMWAATLTCATGSLHLQGWATSC